MSYLSCWQANYFKIMFKLYLKVQIAITLWAQWSLQQLLTFATVSWKQKRQWVSEQAQLCANKTLFTKTRWWAIFGPVFTVCSSVHLPSHLEMVFQQTETYWIAWVPNSNFSFLFMTWNTLKWLVEINIFITPHPALRTNTPSMYYTDDLMLTRNKLVLSVICSQTPA